MAIGSPLQKTGRNLVTPDWIDGARDLKLLHNSINDRWLKLLVVIKHRTSLLPHWIYHISAMSADHWIFCFRLLVYFTLNLVWCTNCQSTKNKLSVCPIQREVWWHTGLVRCTQLMKSQKQPIYVPDPVTGLVHTEPDATSLVPPTTVQVFLSLAHLS